MARDDVVPWSMARTWVAIARPSLVLNQPAGFGHAVEMIVRIAECIFNHRKPFEVVTDLGFHRHADATVQLDRLLTDEFQ